MTKSTECKEEITWFYLESIYRKYSQEGKNTYFREVIFFTNHIYNQHSIRAEVNTYIWTNLVIYTYI